MVRTTEQLGLGMLLASLISIPLILLAAWRSLPTVPILILCGIVGVFFGAIRAFYGRPTRLQAVTEADRQLGFDDLLISAIFSSDHADRGFQTIIHDLAVDRCRRHAPSEVLLRRWGPRSWSATGLAMTAVIILAVIPFQPAGSQATDTNLAVLSDAGADKSATVSTNPGHDASVINDPMSDSTRSNAMDTRASTGISPGDPNATKGEAGRDRTAGVGGGSAGDPSKVQRDTRQADAQGGSSDRSGAIAAGGDSSSNKDSFGDATGGGGVSNLQSNPPAARWSGSAVESAGGSAVNDDRVPPEDRDMVRDFFRR